MSTPPWLQPTYDPIAVQPMRDELIAVGFDELTTVEDVDAVLSAKDDKTVLVVLNSVCGCAAGSARPGVCEALQNERIPDRLVTSFAGQDKAAVQQLREVYFSQIPPSSPFMALVKNGEPIFVLPRHHIEGRSAEQVAHILTHVFNEHCDRQGPSITPEQYEQVKHAKACGSKIPKFGG